MKTPAIAPLGTVSIPDGSVGPWSIETFTISEAEAKMHNLRCLYQRERAHMVDAGTYRRLRHRQRGVVMSNTPMEVLTNREAFAGARGRVLINGLGMGMLLEAILRKPEVTFVRVVELDADVIALTGPHFAHDPRVQIVHADARTYRPARGERFDFVWHDIWDDISGDNLAEMTALRRRYGKRAEAQGTWSHAMAKEQLKRRNRRIYR